MATTMMQQAAVCDEAQDNGFPQNCGGDMRAAAQQLSPTTVMIKNISCRLRPEDVEELLNEVGLQGCYESVYIPSRHSSKKQRTTNFGYAFVKFGEPSSVQECHDRLHGQLLKCGPSARHVEVMMANRQECPGKKRSPMHIPQVARSADRSDSLDDGHGSTTADSDDRAPLDDASEAADSDDRAPWPVVKEALPMYFGGAGAPEVASAPPGLEGSLEQPVYQQPPVAPPVMAVLRKFPDHFTEVHVMFFLDEVGFSGAYDLIQGMHFGTVMVRFKSAALIGTCSQLLRGKSLVSGQFLGVSRA